MYGFPEAISRAFSNYVNFSGRAARSEYWWWVLFVMLVNLLTGFIDNELIGGQAAIFSLVALLVLLLPGLAVTVRRLHDIGRTGWWLLILLVPFIGPVVMLVFALIPGEAGANRFGPNPLPAAQMA